MGFFQRLKQGLSKTRGGLTKKVDELVVSGRPIDDDFYDELTDILILADVGVSATEDIIEKLKERVKEKGVRDTSACRELLKEIIIEEMNVPRPKLQWPLVMFVVGVNGVGKTTTVGKLALRFQEIGHSVILAAADTFRAAADEQLSVWAERAGVPLIRGGEGADPASVVYDAIQAAKARKNDLLIVDTAGRLHNKKNLMDELSKMRRIIDREYPEATMRCMLILDATTGQNGIQQAKQFKEAVEIGGIILTKLDGTAKGGIAIAIRKELDIPVWYIGVGEGIDDLQAFEARQFADALFGDDESKKT
ncbi:MAG: signal recognition particle-docking protein FtsY [Clostridia bacterium]|nr:signal recognition particle-docking protein FtsY [Clostridia bacterium]